MTFEEGRALKAGDIVEVRYYRTAPLRDLIEGRTASARVAEHWRPGIVVAQSPLAITTIDEPRETRAWHEDQFKHIRLARPGTEATAREKEGT